MTCSCAFSGWMKAWLASFGAAGGFLALGLILLWWGARRVRREYFAREPLKRALLYNFPAVLLMGLGTLVILFTMLKSLLPGG